MESTLSRPSMNDIFKFNSSTNRSSRVQRIVNSLKWRQQYQTSDTYPYVMEDGRHVVFQQIINGELKGLGTGAVVWPAAHVLSKYLEIHYGSKLPSMRVCDVGSGTGAVGIVAALLGADVTLTDLDCVAPIMEANISIACDACPSLCCRYQCYDWDATADHLQPPFDLVLVSDCVLPKLYPIEPLIKAVSQLLGETSIALFSYEQRMYPYFDPREEFSRLAALYGLHVSVIPIESHHSFYCSDEIELWYVTRTPVASEAPILCLSAFGAVDVVGVTACGKQWQVYQQPRGDIGCCIWASSVIASRHILRQPSAPCNRKPVALDLGAGCGLASMALSLSGYDVVAIDKLSVMDILRQNVASFAAELGDVENIGNIKCIDFDWIRCSTNDIKRLQEYSYDIILLSDCFYESISVAPVIEFIAKIVTPSTLLIISNELRTAFDEFLTAIRRRGWITEEVPLRYDDLCITHSATSSIHSRPIRLLTAIQNNSS